MIDYIVSGYSAGFNPDKLNAPIVAVSTLPVEYPAVTGGADSGLPMKEIKLTQGKVALVDDEDFERVNQCKWYPRPNGARTYAYRNTIIDGKRTTELMHRFIMNATNNTQLDHRNGNTLDNRKRNLRFCTQSQNLFNIHVPRGLSKYKGVFLHKEKSGWRRWCSQIRVKGKQLCLGTFLTEVEAAMAYDMAALKYHGEFACTNEMLGLFKGVRHRLKHRGKR